ncbi:MAG TPA: hypothetical protein VM537_00970, partial [Anaerolineae bacterium]|nr:hypothetical protein [Anaerolineae bacterium]
MKHPRRYRLWAVALGVVTLLSAVLAATLALPPTLAHAVPPSPERAVQRAWQNAQGAGVYNFASDIVRTKFPAPSLANFG